MGENIVSQSEIFIDLGIAYVELCVADLEAATAEWRDRFDFAVVGRREDAAEGFRSVALQQSDIMLVLTEGTSEKHRAATYVRRHGDGVADIALQVGDVEAALAEAVRRGGRAVGAPVLDENGMASATIAGFGDLVHTFVRSSAAVPGLPAGFVVETARCGSGSSATHAPADLRQIDHFAVCVDAGELNRTVDFYRDVLDFQEIFEERIVVGAQAMNSKVVQSASIAVTFTIIEPDTTAEPGQIDAFLASHEGAGIQHIAFLSDDAATSVRKLRDRGVMLLTTPGSYYDILGERISPKNHGLDVLRELNLLVDEDHGGQLFQIFTRSSHPRRTLFFEVIERVGAETFGSANIKALYEAVELERAQQSGQSQ
ncbi:4-hydroxyphenylpyruvate dioxygenase [Kitasatospora sp. NPDC052896]|uniref:4-hydroxyphenylpyruvate dioxygenase n=1 Tax=Kitasatospora sp. NPDC052896 TaxID=3364061 RepID=UPI0037C57258